MEEALKYELTILIPELQDEIYPTNAPEKSTKPYLVYYRGNTQMQKTLQGYTGNQENTFLFSIMAKEYSKMKSLTKSIEDFLKSLPLKKIGKNKDIFVDDLIINDIKEQWEPELKVNRGIINFTIYY